MKKRFFVIAALFGAAVATADSSAVCKPEAQPADEVSLAAGATAITNGKIALEYAGGVVKITAPGIETPVATIGVNLKPETLGTSVLSNPARKFQMLSLRGPDGSIAFKLEDGEARFAVAYARNAAPVTVKWNAAAVVVPDIFAEDEVLLPGQSERALPPFAPLYLALLNDGDATLACIPVKAKSPAVLSADFTTLTLTPKNNEDYTFVLNAAKGAWHKTALPAQPGEFRTVDDWQVPYKAPWRAALPIAEDFIAPGNGAWSIWNIITVTGNKKRRPINLPPRATMINQETRTNWFGGFEGTFRYPAEFLEGKIKLMHPQFKFKIVHDMTRLVFVYAWRQSSGSPAMPEKYLPPWVAEKHLYGGTNTAYGMKATTCNVTAQFEKIFYREEAAEKSREIAAMLKSMQCFVENIRGRIESGREWRNEMLKFSSDMRKLHPELAADADKLDAAVNEIERLYELDRERIQTPAEAEKLGQEVLKLAVSELDGEKKEEQAKLLGRAIRTIGGSQDSLIAKFRHVGKCIRHIALAEYTTAKTPEAREFWKEAYMRTEALLQGYFCDGK